MARWKSEEYVKLFNEMVDGSTGVMPTDVKVIPRIEIDEYISDNTEAKVTLYGERWRGDKKSYVNLGFPFVGTFPLSSFNLDEGSLALIYGLLRALQPNVCLETGTHRGCSTKRVAQALNDNGRGTLVTVDMIDYGMLSSSLSEEENKRVTQVIGKTPEVYGEEPLSSMADIEFALLDGDHTRDGIIADLEFVSSRIAEDCWVAVDNSDDDGWAEIREFFDTYVDHSHILLKTVSGLELIHMKRSS